jgi:hypothetical protein
MDEQIGGSIRLRVAESRWSCPISSCSCEVINQFTFCCDWLTSGNMFVIGTDIFIIKMGIVFNYI